MSDGIDIERFRQLAQSYGGDIERWPEAIRFAARIRADGPEAQAILEEATKLDAMLDLWNAPEMPADVHRRVNDRATSTGRRFIRRARIWWTSVGIAAVLSGAATGSVATAILGQSAPQAYTNTIFGDLDDEDN